MIVREFECRACQETNRVDSFATDRANMAREEGEWTRQYCTACGLENRVHVNDIVARAASWPTYLATALTGVLVFAAVFFGTITNIYGLILLGGILGIPATVRVAAGKAADAFNGYKI